MLGISTCWWHHRVERGDQIVAGVLDLGLQGVELEYRISETVYRQMKPHLKGPLRVLTIHNFFPRPEGEARGSGDLFFLSSTDADERQRALTYSVRTIQHAHDLGAKVVILHLGRVDMPSSRATVSRNGGDGEAEGVEEERRARRARHQRHLDAVLSSLDVLCLEAEKRKVVLGIENRYHFHEIPDFEELGIILDRFEGANLRYWHDVGHAGVQEHMGFVRQKDLLEAYADRMAGIHLHDFRGPDDHFPPGQGEMDFKMLQPYLKPSHLKIIEVHSRAEEPELRKGFDHIKTIGLL